MSVCVCVCVCAMRCEPEPRGLERITNVSVLAYRPTIHSGRDSMGRVCLKIIQLYNSYCCIKRFYSTKKYRRKLFGFGFGCIHFQEVLNSTYYLVHIVVTICLHMAQDPKSHSIFVVVYCLKKERKRKNILKIHKRFEEKKEKN